MSSHLPKEISQEQYSRANLGDGPGFNIGPVWGRVRAGQTWTVINEKRLVLHAAFDYIVFVAYESTDKSKTGKIFLQSTDGFVSDITSYPLAAAGRSGAGALILADAELQIVIGILSTVSGYGLAAALTTDLCHFAISNRDRIPKWTKAFETLIDVREQLKKEAPTLYNVIFFHVLGEVFKKIADAPNRGRLLGAVIGIFGKKFALKKLHFMGLIFKLLLQVVTKTAAGLPRAASGAVMEKRKAVNNIIENLREAGADVPPADAEKIIAEVSNNPVKMRQILEQLSAAFSDI